MELNKEKYPFVNKGHQYALDVVAGKIPNCIWVIGACKRYLDDLERAKLAVCTFRWEPEKAERFLRIAQKFNHVKGKWKSPNIIFEPWQCFIFMNIHGFIDNRTNERRFRTIYVEVPRGNGKSALCSIQGLYSLAIDDPVGNEIYSAATGKDQARIVFDSAKKMAKANQKFVDKFGIDVREHELRHTKSGSEFRPLASDDKQLDGLQPHTAIIDEIHAHKNGKLYDVIDSAMSKRNDSMMFMITTAGTNTAGIGYQQSKYAKKLLEGKIQDDTWFAIVYSLDKGESVLDQTLWPKANPNFGISVDPINFEAKVKKALESPAAFTNLKVKHFNIWTAASDPYFTVKKWSDLKANITLEQFRDKKCYAGIDLATKWDLCCFSWVFYEDDIYSFFVDSFIPQDTFNIMKEKVPEYVTWHENGWLTVLPGAVNDFAELRKIFKERCKMFNMLGAVYDPWNAHEFALECEKDNICEMIEMSMNTKNLSEPTKKLEELIRSKKCQHPGNPLAEWSLGNVMCKEDKNGNVFPHKDGDNNKIDKIDPTISKIMGLAAWINRQSTQSPYETRGIFYL